MLNRLVINSLVVTFQPGSFLVACGAWEIRPFIIHCSCFVMLVNFFNKHNGVSDGARNLDCPRKKKKEKKFGLSLLFVS